MAKDWDHGIAMCQGRFLMLSFIKCIFGFGNVYDGSICRYSKWIFDFHYYHVEQGGDGTCCAMHEYTCHKCGKKFGI